MISFVDLKAQYLTIREEINEAIAQVLDKCQFVLGEAVEAFESEFAQYCQAKYAVAVNSGTSALHVALLAADLRPGDEVITVSHTFVATAAAIRYVGAKPVFVDIDPRSYTMDPSKIEAAITPRTKVILPVHLYGQCADMDPILEVARRHKLVVIEDAAQAHGALYRGSRAGSLSDLACFSFYPGKNLGAYGEGGAVVTSNLDFVRKIKILRDQGQSRKYYHEMIGFNYRLEGIQGAVLRVKLKHLDDWNSARRRHAAKYRDLLPKVGITLLDEMEYGRPVYHIFPIFSPHRDELQGRLNNAGVATGIHYPIPVHLQPAYIDLGYSTGSLPVTERAARTTLSLPMYAELPEEDLAVVAESIHQSLSEVEERAGSAAELPVT